MREIWRDGLRHHGFVRRRFPCRPRHPDRRENSSWPRKLPASPAAKKPLLNARNLARWTTPPRICPPPFPMQTSSSRSERKYKRASEIPGSARREKTIAECEKFGAMDYATTDLSAAVSHADLVI